MWQSISSVICFYNINNLKGHFKEASVLYSSDWQSTQAWIYIVFFLHLYSTVGQGVNHYFFRIIDIAGFSLSLTGKSVSFHIHSPFPCLGPDMFSNTYRRWVGNSKDRSARVLLDVNGKCHSATSFGLKQSITSVTSWKTKSNSP